MKHLTSGQRYQIEAYLKSGKSILYISEELQVSKSTIYRELKRNAQKRGAYKAAYAEQLAGERKERFCTKRKFTYDIMKIVERHIVQDQWSPEQIVGYYHKQGQPMVSFERIYQHIREDKQNKGTLYKHLRHRLKHRKRPVSGKKVKIPHRVSINDRPEIINQRKRFGDWEIDTIVGKENKGAIVTIVERQTGFLMMQKLPGGKKAEQLSQQVIQMLLPYKKHTHSITSDNGTEFVKHEMIAKKLSAAFYFANPYASWERGLNEYTNKLIRQYIPKKSNFNDFSNQQIKEIQMKINSRPRKKLKYNSPTQLFFKLVS